jgi:hypothetical protein
MGTNKPGYKGKNFIISFDSQEGIIFLEDWGGVDEEKALEMKEKVVEFSEKIPPNKLVRLLVEAEKYEYAKVTPEARRVFLSLAKIIRNKKTKIALVTSSPTVRLVSRFLAIGIKDFNSFATKEEGIKWLKSK